MKEPQNLSVISFESFTIRFIMKMSNLYHQFDVKIYLSSLFSSYVSTENPCLHHPHSLTLLLLLHPLLPPVHL